MSIAVSATVQPSRILAYMLAFMFVLVNVAIGYLAFCFKANQLYFSLVIILSIVLSVHLLFSYFRRQQVVRLDISDVGDIIFQTVTPNSLNLNCVNLIILESCTLWPQLMVISLRSEDGRIVVLPVLRDSVDAITFRKLAVALNWMAMQVSDGPNFGVDMPSGNF